MRKTLASFFSYMGCIAMAGFVTLFIEGTIGMILIYALLIALLVSLVMTLAVLRRIRVHAETAQSAVFKGDELFFDVRIDNASLFPAAAVEVEIEASAHLMLEGQGVLTGAVTGKGFNSLSFALRAKHFGKARVRIRSIRLSDYLGIFSFAVKMPDALEEQIVAIYPDIPEVSMQTDFLQSANLFAGDEDDEEESSETSLIPTGLAGYDHREYVPGDPLKRINWKLSSKRDVLMVRLDEKIRASGRSVFFDCPALQENDEALSVRDHVAEGALALLVSLLEEGREAVFAFCKQELWIAAEIRSIADVYALQEELSSFEAGGVKEFLPSALRQLAKSPICFTAAMKDNCASVQSIVGNRPDTVVVCSHAASLPAFTANQWVLTDDFSLDRM